MVGVQSPTLTTLQPNKNAPELVLMLLYVSLVIVIYLMAVMSHTPRTVSY